eukprot:3867192-Pleurochrysis_carterae.AAC.1
MRRRAHASTFARSTFAPNTTARASAPALIKVANCSARMHAVLRACMLASLRRRMRLLGTAPPSALTHTNKRAQAHAPAPAPAHAHANAHARTRTRARAHARTRTPPLEQMRASACTNARAWKASASSSATSSCSGSA